MIEVPERLVEAGARGAAEKLNGTPWESLTNNAQQSWINTARACLAAAFAGAEVVHRTKKESADVQVNVAITVKNATWVNILPEVPLNDGDTILILRGAE